MAQLLERDDELGLLSQWLGDAETGRGRVVFVGGEPGIGKTSLVTTFAAGVDAAVRIGFGRCDALGHTTRPRSRSSRSRPHSTST